MFKHSSSSSSAAFNVVYGFKNSMFAKRLHQKYKYRNNLSESQTSEEQTHRENAMLKWLCNLVSHFDLSRDRNADVCKYYELD